MDSPRDLRYGPLILQSNEHVRKYNFVRVANPRRLQRGKWTCSRRLVLYAFPEFCIFKREIRFRMSKKTKARQRGWQSEKPLSITTIVLSKRFHVVVTECKLCSEGILHALSCGPSKWRPVFLVPTISSRVLGVFILQQLLFLTSVEHILRPYRIRPSRKRSLR